MTEDDDISFELGMLHNRMQTRLNREEGLSRLDQVVEEHGRIEGEPFSFEGHEFQRQIINDTHSRVYVRKCSQVGLSELMVQKLLAMASVLRHKRIIFTLPVAHMAAKFSKDRIDGVINQSPYYGSMVKAANNSASQKLINTTTLYVGGTYGDTGAISVPAYAVVSDEIDFSNQVTLGKLSSRLRHAPKDDHGYAGLRFEFSTPTVEEFGIDERYNRGNQMCYHAECSGCNRWVVPDFLKDFKIPGYDKSMVELEKADFRNPDYRFDQAWIACPSCGHDLWEDLCDPARRKWIATAPHNYEHSYQVYPWDVPTYNTPQSIIRQFEEYSTFQDFMNFVVGLPFTSPDNSFMVDEAHKKRITDVELWVFNHYVVTKGTVIGMDVGKVCHLTVALVAGNYTHVVWAEELRNSPANPATEQVLERFDYYKCVAMCVDAGPDLTLVNTLVVARGLGRITAVQYVRTVSGLGLYTEHDDGELIKAARTKSLGETLKRHNTGKIHYAKTVADLMFPHLKNLKKVRELDSSGEYIDRFEKIGPDHFAHSLNYLELARARMVEGLNTGVVGAPATVSKTRIGSKAKSTRDQKLAKSRSAPLIGSAGRNR